MKAHIILAIALMPAFHPAFAQKSAAIHYGDLNLSRARDNAVLDRRIRHAATQICGERPSRGLEAQRHHDACRKEIIANADMQLAQRKSAAKMAMASRR